MEIEFKCKKCSNIFTCDIGEATISEESFRPEFEKEIICPKCGKLSIDDVLLTEKGQGQLTEATFIFDDDDLFDYEDDDMDDYGSYEGTCQGCDIFFKPLNDLGLCEECAGKLERDMIRQRDWAYSISAFGMSNSELEKLRKGVIEHYGEKLELIAPNKKNKRKPKRKNRKRKHKTKKRR